MRQEKWLWLAAFVGLFSISQGWPPAGGAMAAQPAWITDSLEKIHADDIQGAARPLYLSGGLNSFIDFQVHVSAGLNPLNLAIEAGPFVPTAGGVNIPASDVFVYREAYLNITQLSDANGRLGPTPDPLIPTTDPYLKQSRNAFPVTVPANTTQSVWIDVFVPPSAIAGTYKGKITVLNGASVIATLHPQIKVWPFALPSTSTLSSAFAIGWDAMCIAAYGSYANCGQYPGANGDPDRGVDLTHVAEATMLLDHRLSIDDTVYYGPPDGTWAHHDSAYGPALNGTLPTILKGAALTTAQFFYVSSDTSAVIGNWVKHYQAKGWLSKLFDYTCDEPPNGCSWAQLATRAAAMHAGSPLMATLVTTDIETATTNGVLSQIDILTPVVDHMEPSGSANQRSTYDAWLAQPNKRLWWYQSCDEHESCSDGVAGPASSTWPSYMVDASSVRNRVFQWLAYLDRIGGELYYQIDYCWTPQSGGQCPGADPWTSVYAFGGNGDGTLIYPGTPARIGGSTPIPVPSIRLKLIRDGMQDYEMLRALDTAGHAGQAKAIAHRFITNATTFKTLPADMAAAREALGDALAAISPSAP